VDFTVRHLSSSTEAFPGSWGLNSGNPCVGNGVHQVFSSCNSLLFFYFCYFQKYYFEFLFLLILVFCPLCP
jgi:hypothetical protein